MGAENHCLIYFTTYYLNRCSSGSGSSSDSSDDGDSNDDKNVVLHWEQNGFVQGAYSSILGIAYSPFPGPSFLKDVYHEGKREKMSTVSLDLQN